MVTDNKKFIPPFYEEDDEIEDDINPTDDEGEEENELEKKQSMTTTTPFAKPQVDSPAWGGQSNNSSPGTSSFWPNTPPPQRSPTWGRTPSTPTWGQPSTPSWGSSGTASGWGSSSVKREELDRTKKVIFCDVLDCLVETYQSNGRPGLAPRGIYDIKLRFDVWDKIGCIGPERIYAMIPKEMHLNTIGSRAWQVTLEYICCCLTEYLRIPFTAVQIVTQCAVGQPKDEVIGGMIDKINLDVKDVLHIGLGSGLPGQHNKDSMAAEVLGISYVDLGQLMTSYF